MGHAAKTTTEDRQPRQTRHCQDHSQDESGELRRAPAGVFELVGTGYQTSPTILAAMTVLMRDLGRAEESLADARAALSNDGGDGHELAMVGYGLTRTLTELSAEIKRHRQYLASSEPHRLAELDR